MPKKTCQLIIDSANDYVIAVKDNQPKLHRHIQRIAALRYAKRQASGLSPASRYIATEKTRDRLTTRTVEVFHDLNGIDSGWTG